MYKVFYLTYFLLPILVLLQILLMCGISYALSAISVYLRDIKELLQMYTTISIFLTPIAFLPGSAPHFLEIIFYFNPFSYIIWAYQDILYEGKITNYYVWVFLLLFYPIVFILGYRTFRKLKPYFGHAL